MKKLLTLTAYALFIWMITFISCQKELGCYDCNQPPVANAGADQKITLPKDSVLLDGSTSVDPDGKIVAWSWTRISGPASSTITNASMAITIAKNLTTGIYQFELKVTDNKGLWSKDTVQVILVNPVVNQPPVANAGADQIIKLPTDSVLLNGSKSIDPDNNITTYNWSKISGPSSSNIANASAVQTAVKGLVQGVYQFELKVTDAGGLSSKDTVQITVELASIVSCDLSLRPVIDATLTEIGKLSEPRIPAVGAAGNKIVYAGGWNGVYCQMNYYKSSSAVDIYDRNSGAWTTAQLSNSRGDIAVASVGNKIFFAGGVNWENYQSLQWSGSYDNVDIYDVSNNTWSVAHLSKGRESICAVVVGNKVIFAGGTYFTKNSLVTNPVANASDAVDIYDAATNTWSVAKLSVARTDISAVVIGNNVYFASGSGYGNTTDNLNIVDVYNSSTSAWSTSSLADDVTLKQSYQVGNYITWSKNNQVTIKNITTGANTSNCVSGYVFGTPVLKNDFIAFPTGTNASGALTQLDLYNINTTAWSVLRVIPGIAGTVNASVISVNNTLYLAGGSNTNGGCNVTFYDKVYTLNW
jgi:hypothetical protein